MNFLDKLGLGIHLYFDPGAAPRQMRQFARQVTGIRAGISGMSSGLRTMMSGVGRFATVAGIAAGAAAVAAAKTGKSLLDFDDAIRKVGASLGISLNEFDKIEPALSGMARKMSTEFGATQVKAADTMTIVAKAGLHELSEIQAASRQAFLLSIADAEISADKAADVLIKMLNLFQKPLNAKNFTEFSDKLVFTANSAATNVTELAAAMKYFGPMAAGMKNVTFEQGLGALAMLSSRGINASIAGTTLNRIFAQSGKSTSRKMQAALGIDLTDQQGAFKSIVGFMSEYADKLKGITNEQDMFDATIRLAETRGSKGVLVLTQGLEELGQRIKDIEGATGTTAAAAEIRLNGMKFAWDKITSAVGDVVLSVGEQFKPELIAALASIKEWITSLGEAFRASAQNGDMSKFSQTIQDIVHGVEKAPQHFREMWDWLGKMKDKFKDIVGTSFFEKFATWTVALTPIAILLSPAIAMFSAMLSLASSLLTILLGGGTFGYGLVRAMYALGAAGSAGAAAPPAGAGAGAAAGFRFFAKSLLKGVGYTYLIWQAGKFAWRWYSDGFKEAAREGAIDIGEDLGSLFTLPFRLAGYGPRDITTNPGGMERTFSSHISDAYKTAEAAVASGVFKTLAAQWRELYVEAGGYNSPINNIVAEGRIGMGFDSDISRMRFNIDVTKTLLDEREKIIADHVARARALWRVNFNSVHVGFQGLFGLFQRYRDELATTAITAAQLVPVAIVNPVHALISAIGTLMQTDPAKKALALTVNTRLCRDAMAGSVSRHQMELTERAGANVSAWQRRSINERGSVPIRGKN